MPGSYSTFTFRLFICIVGLISANDGFHHEDGSFFKYGLTFSTQKHRLDKATHLETVRTSYRGIPLKCSYQDYNHLLSEYSSTSLDIGDFQKALKNLTHLQAFQRGCIYVLQPQASVSTFGTLGWRIVVPEFYNMGLYSHGYFWRKKISPLSSAKQAYYTEVYDNGAACPRVGRSRRTEVVYICSWTEEKISLISETSTCEYEIHVRTPKVCDCYRNNGFVHPIRCSLDMAL